MPQMPVYITMSSTGVSRIVNVDYNKPTPCNIAVGASFSSTSAMTCTYGVEFTMDDTNLQALYGSTRAAVWQADANLPAGTSSEATTNYMFPPAALRFTVSAISSGSVTFSVIQG
jgi:hypothetical protein